MKDVVRTTTLDTLAVLENAFKAVAPAENREVYGYLIILVRDTYDKSDEVHHLLFGEEVPDEEAPNYHDTVDEIDRRNLLRGRLTKIFREIKVWCLPQPHADINGESSEVTGCGWSQLLLSHITNASQDKPVLAWYFQLQALVYMSKNHHVSLMSSLRTSERKAISRRHRRFLGAPRTSASPREQPKFDEPRWLPCYVHRRHL